MRVLQLCLSPAFGGLEIHVRDFTLWLIKQPEVIPFLAIQDKTRLHQALAQEQVEILTFTSKTGYLPLIKALRLANFINRNAIDIVHVHWKYDLALVALAKAYSKNNFRLIHTRHMILPGKKYDIYHKFIYRSLDYFIATTRLIETQARNNLPIEVNKIRQIYLGSEPPEKISPEHRKELIKKYNLPDQFKVGLFGRICAYKGQHLLLEAVETLKREKIYIIAVIIGHVMEPDYFDHLKRYILEKKLRKQIIFIDFVENPGKLMQCMDTLVLTTRHETFGLVLVEGMHAGVPVIGSNAGGVPEIIEHESNGLLFETSSSESLAQALKRVYQDKGLRAKMIRNGYRYAREKFNGPIQFEKVLHTLKDTLKNNK